MRNRRAKSAGVWIAALALTGGLGCDLSNPGVPVPPADVNFPIAIEVVAEAADARFLVVANSNYDVKYSSGTLQSWSIAAIDDAIAAAQAATGCGLADVPPCGILIEADGGAGFLTHEVRIGSQADGLEYSADRDRFYLPVRSGRGVLTWVDFRPSQGVFECDALESAGEIPSCSSAHRGADVAPSAEGLSLPTDPVALAVVPNDLLGPEVAPGTVALVVPHRSGRASLFLDDPASPRPVFTDVITDISFDISSATLDPATGFVWVTSSAVVRSDSSRPTNQLLAIAPVAAGGSARLVVTQRVTLTGISDGFDTRDIVFEPMSTRAWVLSRRPESVLTLDFSVPPLGAGLAPIGDIFAVASGPSRMERVTIASADGLTTKDYLVVSCYDANNVSIVDPELGLVATVAGLAGPFDMAFDPTTQRLFVTNFANSTIGVIDLAPLATGETPLLVATLGEIDPPNPF